MPQVRVWEAIALSCDTDPQQKHDRAFLDEYREALRYDNSARAAYADFQSRCDIAESNLAAGYLDADCDGADLHRSVNTRVFVEWAERLKWTVPAEFQTLGADIPAREGFALDPDSETYPRELDIAFFAWRAASRAPKSGTSPKTQIKQWLDTHYTDLSDKAKERISTVCNWNPKGGKPET